MQWNLPTVNHTSFVSKSKLSSRLRFYFRSIQFSSDLPDSPSKFLQSSWRFSKSFVSSLKIRLQAVQATNHLKLNQRDLIFEQPPLTTVLKKKKIQMSSSLMSTAIKIFVFSIIRVCKLTFLLSLAISSRRHIKGEKKKERLSSGSTGKEMSSCQTTTGESGKFHHRRMSEVILATAKTRIFICYPPNG